VSLLPIRCDDAAASPRLTDDFVRDLRAADIFSGVDVGTPTNGTEILLTGSAIVLKQPGDDKSVHFSTGESILLIPIYALWGVGILVGVPSDCGDADVDLAMQAVDARNGNVLREWRVKASGGACAGLYYGGWPLGDALQKAVSQLLEEMRCDASGITARYAAATVPQSLAQTAQSK
jgi:hypothetical protein